MENSLWNSCYLHFSVAWQGLNSCLSWNLLVRSGWPQTQTYSDPPAAASVPWAQPLNHLPQNATKSVFCWHSPQLSEPSSVFTITLFTIQALSTGSLVWLFRKLSSNCALEGASGFPENLRLRAQNSPSLSLHGNTCTQKASLIGRQSRCRV